jgi:hypothetical protein
MCVLREAVNGPEQLSLFALQLLPESVLLHHLVLLNLPKHHLSHVGQQVAAVGVKLTRLVVNDAPELTPQHSTAQHSTAQHSAAAISTWGPTVILKTHVTED